MDHEARWNARYRDAGDDYLFGIEPNHFLARRAHHFQDGHTALCVADGEGRNSVWLAEQGLQVTAAEISPTAVAKARKLAAGRGMVTNRHAVLRESTFRVQRRLSIRKPWSPRQ